MDVKSLEQEPMIIPGEYEGIWAGYSLQIEYHNGNKSHWIKLNQGIRGMSRCEVIVDNNGWIYVK